VHRDGAALGAILDERFIFTYGGEAPIDKSNVMKIVLANNNPSPSTPSEQRVLVDGDVAIATGVETVDKVVDGKPVKKANRYTTTFAHRDGHWRALSVHMAPVPPALADLPTNRP
jgi:ketosteroid isomerase-like protein